MKKLFNIIRNTFAIFGLVALVGHVVLYYALDDYDVTITARGKGLENRCNTLRESGPYLPNSSSFSMQIVQDSLRASEIRRYFNLDSICLGASSSWDKTLRIASFVASHIPHDNQEEYPKHVNAIGLWEYTKDVAPAFNCRLHSILTFELLVSADLTARYVTCMPQDEDDYDCHVVNEVWLPELSKWAMIDTDMDGNYFTDTDGTPLSLREIRDCYIAGTQMLTHPEFGDGTDELSFYYAYMAKNSYWYSCWETLSFFREDKNMSDSIPSSRLVNLVPSGFQPSSRRGPSFTTSDADRFWAPANLSRR